MDSNVAEAGLPDPLHEEHEHLIQVLTLTQRMLQQLQLTSKFSNTDTTDALEAQTADEVAQEIVNLMRADQLHALEHVLRDPYFGRLDFLPLEDENPLRLYIGKRGLEESDSGERLVIDWRAPVSSLFYSFSGKGDYASYDTPSGTVDGQVYLKRNIVVRDGELQRVVDSFVKGQENLGVTDEFLLYRLAENKDSRLRDIVSTIQAEQDRIIRAERDRAILIQGVAGSGKTTVALHRLAYILYQHKEQLRADRMAIFAPNAMFVDYISEVLPELGVGGIKQTTFSDWALEVLEFAVRLRDPGRRLTRWFAVRQDAETAAHHEAAHFKGSRRLMTQLSLRVKELEEQGVPYGDFEVWEGLVLREDTIRRWYFEEYSHYPLAQRKDRVLARVKRWYETEYRKVQPDDPKKTFKKVASQRLRAYEKKWPQLSAVAIYQETLADLGLGLRAKSEKGMRKGQRPEVEVEDVAPILYVHQKLHGIDPRDRFDHVVIDEAQDFSPVQIEVLKAYCPSLSFTILGDLSQSIHTYQGITNWDAFLSLFPAEKADFYQLDVSYRSTMEIIEFANAVIRNFAGFSQAKPVFRSGEPVVVSQVEATRWTEHAVAAVRSLKAEVHTVAVVCRTEEDSRICHQALEKAGLTAQLIDASQKEYHGGISVLPVYLTKGLEFDAVLMVGVDAENYAKTPLSAKLLYVGCTRALHKLWLQYAGAISPLIAAEAAAKSSSEFVLDAQVAEAAEAIDA